MKLSLRTGNDESCIEHHKKIFTEINNHFKKFSVIQTELSFFTFNMSLNFDSLVTNFLFHKTLNFLRISKRTQLSTKKNNNKRLRGFQLKINASTNSDNYNVPILNFFLNFDTSCLKYGLSHCFIKRNRSLNIIHSYPFITKLILTTNY